MKTVVFAVPTYSKQPCLEFNMSALNTQQVLAGAGINTVWRYVGGDPYVHKARNKLASEFLTEHKNATDLFFLDDDLGWSADAVLKFVMRDEDVVCGVYPKKNDALEFPVHMTLENGNVVEKRGLYKADLAATGFMRIKRHVVQACALDSGEYQDPDSVKGHTTCWDMFRTGFIPFEAGGKKGRWWGEDYFFSVMVRTLGFGLWIDPTLTFTHRGSKAWSGSFNPTLQDWIASLKKEKEEASCEKNFSLAAGIAA